MNDNLTIREFEPTDAHAYRTLRLQALRTNPDAFVTVAEEFEQRPVAHSAANIKQNAESADAVMLGAFVDDQPVGMMGLFRSKYIKKRHIAHLNAVYVSPEWRGKGVGGRLLDAIIGEAKQMAGVEQIVLTVNANGRQAIALYRSRGFESFGREVNSMKWNGKYQDEEYMVLRL